MRIYCLFLDLKKAYDFTDRSFFFIFYFLIFDTFKINTQRFFYQCGHILFFGPMLVPVISSRLTSLYFKAMVEVYL
jgi:hypothetical protein